MPNSKLEDIEIIRRLHVWMLNRNSTKAFVSDMNRVLTMARWALDTIDYEETQPQTFSDEMKFRPFKSKEEFEPFRYRWWKEKGRPAIYPPRRYDDESVGNDTWEQAFLLREFDCGHPFGVRIY